MRHQSTSSTSAEVAGEIDRRRRDQLRKPGANVQRFSIAELMIVVDPAKRQRQRSGDAAFRHHAGQCFRREIGSFIGAHPEKGIAIDRDKRLVIRHNHSVSLSRVWRGGPGTGSAG